MNIFKSNLNKALKDILKVKALEELIKECDKRLEKLNMINFSQEDLKEILTFTLISHKALFKSILSMQKSKKLRSKTRNEQLYQ